MSCGMIKEETRTGREDISFTYDSKNNRKEMTLGNKVTAYKYNRNDELLRTDTLDTNEEEDSVVIYKNDRNGNQLAAVNRHEIPEEKKGSPYIDIDVTLGDNRLNENVVNHYNAQNQLIKTLTKNYKVSYTYDAEGLRTSKTVNGEKTVCVWDGDQLELSESGKVKKRYVRGNDRGYGSNLIFADSGAGTEKQYYVTDPHGSVVQLTDENGKVTKTYEYDSFGNEVKPDKKDENPFCYCGEYYDKETEEVYLRARYYQPKMGRFLTRDTYTGEEDEPESLHLYTYCYNNPVVYSDNGGNSPVSDVLAAGMRVAKNVSASTKKNKSGGKKGKKAIYKKKGMGKTYHWPKDDTGKTWSRNLKVCTDGKIKYGSQAKKGHEGDDKYCYGDTTHEGSISYGDTISSDFIPYVVITVGDVVETDLSVYLHSLAVITCGSNVKGAKVKKGDYLYCAVLETHNVKEAEMGEVSIYAAWKVLGIKNKEHIGNIFPENRGGKWKIDIFEKSMPKGNWSKNEKKLRKQIYKHGYKCYRGKGKCLNPKK